MPDGARLPSLPRNHEQIALVAAVLHDLGVVDARGPGGMLAGEVEQALEIGDLGRDTGELNQDSLMLAKPIKRAVKIGL
ncbi:hypothetical protein [Microvirga yunnanensis]|uniref:hypothetical protein n=1 Tax=Microvirga yunnanensis TaxID=2953740 RepID=UPI0021C9EE40|nr:MULTISPECIES: hypothetical protein [unclassified Microvirga]